MRRALTGVVVALLAVLCAAGCSAETSSTKNVSGDLRTDLETVVSRFPVLAGASSIDWVAGTLGIREAPGPSLYWIDAVVTLDDDHLERLVAGSDLEPGDAPEVHELIAEDLPAGPYLRSSKLDSTFSTGEYRSTVAIDQDAGVLVLTTVFE
ncbi:hypothetical protein [Microbacterium sp. 18062]|uniref:hypothetical protein n=1 Tax=Microbacterium sp. 18062 TaxID=2681410 RepID=UPI00135B8E5A|nr:hypothetical protein [Microbacterium sp. 18062]